MAYQEFLSATAVALGTRPDGTLRTLTDPTTLLYDSFETLDTTNTWVIGGTVPPTGVAGQLTVAPGTTANASSFAKSQPAFIPSSNGWLVYASLYQLETGVVTGNKRVWGLGTYVTPTFAVPITNGTVFEIDDVTGALQASVYSNSVRTTVVALTRPTDGLQHRYSITYRGSRAYFDIDGVTVTTIQNPSLQVSALALITVSFNGAAVVASAPTLISTLNGLGDSGKNSTKIADGIYPWRVQTVKAASTAALLTDLPAIVALHPGSPTPNFLAAQAVTGPLTDTQLRASAFAVTMVNTLALTDTQIRATPLAVSGSFFQTTQPVSIASMPSTPVTGIFFQTTQPVSGAFFQTTQPVSLATNTPDVIDRAGRLLGIASIKGLALAVQTTPFAAAAVGSTTGYDVSTAANITFIVANTVDATAWTGNPVIVFEQSHNNISWALLGVVRNDTNLSASTHTLPANAANTEYMFDAALEGVNFIRARVTTGTTTGGMTIVMQPGSMPFSPVVTVIQNPETTKVIGRVGIDQTTLGTTNAVQIVPGTTNGLTSFQLVSAATTNATVLKASAGQVYGWYIYNSNAAARKLVFHNTAAAPTAGAAVFLSLMIPPGSGANVHMSTGIQFSAGIAITTTTGIANTDAVAVALNDLIINIFYK